jgi:hypothetical protein
MGTVMQQDDVISDFTMFVFDHGAACIYHHNTTGTSSVINMIMNMH